MSAPAGAKRAATAKKAAESAEKSEDESEETPAADEESEAKDSEAEGETRSALSEDESEAALIDGSADGEGAQEVSESEAGRLPLTQTDDVFTPTGGETSRDDEYAGAGYANAASDIERLLDSMAEKSVHTQLERQRTKDLAELAGSISYGNIHDGVDKTVHRIADVKDDLKEEYDLIAAPLLHISKQLQRSVTQQLKDKRRGGKQTGLLMGRRLDAHALPRNDGRVFYKNNLPAELPELAVGLLLDESGSMFSCDRATYARATAIILYDFCRSLGIPVMVYGHSTSGGSVDLYSYAEFEAIDRDDRYRMMDISARSNNRDGAALRFVAEQLSKRREDVKMLILVSDGQPADSGYYGTAAEEDLRGVKHEYERKGILFVAAAIGSDKDNIERIYGNSFMDITDLEKLPVTLAGVVKRHIRV
jgi:cobalamin biosynthesis protein CobT